MVLCVRTVKTVRRLSGECRERVSGMSSQGSNENHERRLPCVINPSLYVVPLGDDGCYIDDRGGGAAADELGEADQAWGIEDSMSSLS